MSPNTLRVHTDLHAEIVEVEIEVVSPSIVPSENFAELNRTVTCMVLKANDRRTSCPCHDEFREPRSDYVRQDNTVPIQTCICHLASPRQPMTVRTPNGWTLTSRKLRVLFKVSEKETAPIPRPWSGVGIL
ncbi:hypothetical protein TNCV_1347092 [Trichonephila clavipes]|nr:hypothetical protein TNCV_1347092 [Trichonephila clavipes]